MPAGVKLASRALSALFGCARLRSEKLLRFRNKIHNSKVVQFNFYKGVTVFL
jgi:hypothetical protein